MPDIEALLTRPEFPLSQAYDNDWILDNQMGPNALWLVEWLTGRMGIRPGMRVLDLACGRGMTSVFLAREFRAQVYAVDLWIDADKNWKRALSSGVSDNICPIQAEAHALPFAAGFFDAVVSIDGYQYFGGNPLYLQHLARLVRPGGEIGVVVPGLTRPIDDQPPPHLLEPQSNGKAFWDDDCWSFETAETWRKRWSRTKTVENVVAETLPDGWRHWRDFEIALEKSGKALFPSDAEALDRDRGETVGFVGITARRTEEEGPNLFEPGLAARFGVDV